MSQVIDFRERAIKRGAAKNGIFRDKFRESVDAYEAALWQPIETAPKDGTRVIGWHRGWAHPFEMVWCEQNQGTGWYNDDDRELGAHYLFEPTHWRPLPSPPETSS